MSWRNAAEKHNGTIKPAYKILSKPWNHRKDVQFSGKKTDK